MRKYMVVVSGAPATGKTYLSKKIGERYSIPVSVKDEYKEMLFDCLKVQDHQMSEALDLTSFEMTYDVVEKLMKTGTPFVVEGNFEGCEPIERLKKLINMYEYEVLHIYCHALPEILYNRFKSRQNSGERHPSHGKIEDTFEEYLEVMDGRVFKLDFQDIIEIETSDFHKVSYEEIFQYIDKKII